MKELISRKLSSNLLSHTRRMHLRVIGSSSSSNSSSSSSRSSSSSSSSGTVSRSRSRSCSRGGSR